LIGCGPRVEVQSVVPESLTEPVIVECPMGETARVFGNCVIRLRAGLDESNSRLEAIRQMLTPR
jgi:hypothetical protein